MGQAYISLTSTEFLFPTTNCDIPHEPSVRPRRRPVELLSR